MSRPEQCDFCSESYLPIRGFFHFFSELFFCLILLFKYICWQIFTVFRLPTFKKLPCKNCKHSAIYHLLILAADNSTQYGSMTAFDILIKYKFKAADPINFDECIRCSITKLIKREKESPCYYEKLKNLEYLEYLYDKGDRK